MIVAADTLAPFQAEISLLGSVILDQKRYWEISEEIAPPDFLDARHSLIFRVMGDMLNGDRNVDDLTLYEEIKRQPSSVSLDYLLGLTEGLYRQMHLGSHIAIVKRASQLRGIAKLAEGVREEALSGAIDPDVLAANFDSGVLGVIAEHDQSPSLQEQAEAAYELIEKRNRKLPETAFASTGIASLDRIIGGYKRQKLYVVGGRPSMGKTSLLIEAVIQHCVRKMPCHIFELEMTSEDLLHRIWAAVAEVSYERLTDAESLTAEEMTQIAHAKDLTAKWPLVIDDRADLSIDQILARARMSIRRRGTQFIGIDYLQKIRFGGRAEARYLAVTDAVVRASRLSKSENIPVMMLSSLTERGDKDVNRRPTLADLRQSGDVQYEADVAILIHRERLGDDQAIIAPEAELIVAKQRGGRTGKVTARYDSNTLLFGDARQ